ncbi:hypothetical protein DO021_12275 [Desulfobacter hydrogenophilus]|uniref:Uncharacterized protein n=1 Tax=Desulfobacter hydrogenophilus TaxID=2291 RepID=A0A328FBU7_9BACT|nr:hypothetical protein [Desulfobacter hydrogenophilus]NDY72440.1 hypothetical protein [Desulfobacter hydrogenophilus]QBH13762.1 hypothetical protein EYB58_13025 [Desulfobacter hydrogenophilus]RAM01706.1 hypothetical protein DO021_12275 [Desulfobacter hydrogenophilus]
MKHFPFKVVVFCLLVTPVLYMITLAGCRDYLEKKYLLKIENEFIGNSSDLLNGSVHIEDQIAKNIQAILNRDALIRMAKLDLEVQVIQGRGKIIYPIYVGTDGFKEDSPGYYDAQAVADKNFSILNSGLKVHAVLHMDHGSFLANFIFALYSGISLLIFFIFYRRGSKRAEQEREARNALIHDLKKNELRHEKLEEDLTRERAELFKNIKQLDKKYQSEQKKAKINEDEMFNEIIGLEDQLNTYIELKERRDVEINELKSNLEKYERKKSAGQSKRGEFNFISKRFKTLYKHVEMSRKALNGFINLTEDQQIKAEETIHQLDRDPGSVIVKRKVFSGKKHKATCFEVLFAYNGRLYFMNHPNKTQVVVIGTKQTQTKDMEYLHNL